MERDTLLTHLQELLDPDGVADYGPNGLQVEGAPEVDRIVTGVTASRNLIEAAIAKKADTILVHHGLFWKSDTPPPLTGWLGDRVRLLMRHDINLIAYHLPLDAHAELGNNRMILDGLGLGAATRFGANDLGMMARLDAPEPAADLVERLRQHLETDVIHLDGGPDAVRTIGVVTGAGQRYFEAAIAAGCDAFITGEASEFVTHVAREAGVHYLWAGHHATEKGGVRALGEHLARRFPLEVTFVDDANPV